MHTTFSLHRFRSFNFLIATLALVLGGMFYILFRVSEPAFFGWMKILNLDSIIDVLRDSSFLHRFFLPEWVIYSLPNGLWAFAYALVITGIWAGSRSWLKYLWMASIPLLILGFEIFQYINILPGTFCAQDIAMGLAGLFFGIVLGIKINKKKSYEKTHE